MPPAARRLTHPLPLIALSLAAASAFTPPAALPPPLCTGVSSTMLRRSYPLLLALHGSVKGTRALRHSRTLEASRAMGGMMVGHGPDPDVATSYFKTANVYSSQGKYEQALELFRKSVAIRIKVHGPDHPNLVAAYNNMAVVNYQQGNYDEAVALFERSLAILLRVHGEDHPSVAGAYNGLANVCNAQGKFEEALALHNKSLHIRIKEHGPDHPVVAASYKNIAVMRAVLGHDEEVHGKDHPDVAAAFNSLAVMVEVHRKHKAALALRRKRAMERT